MPWSRTTCVCSSVPVTILPKVLSAGIYDSQENSQKFTRVCKELQEYTSFLLTPYTCTKMHKNILTTILFSCMPKQWNEFRDHSRVDDSL